MPPLSGIFGRIISRVRTYVKERLPSSLLPLAEELPEFLRGQVLRMVQSELRSTFSTFRSFKSTDWFYSLITTDPAKVNVLPNQMISIDIAIVGPDGRYIRFELRLPSGKPLDRATLGRRMAAQLTEEWKKRGIKTTYPASEYIKLARYKLDYYLITRQPKAQSIPS